jgi:hypothetical protein
MRAGIFALFEIKKNRLFRVRIIDLLDIKYSTNSRTNKPLIRTRIFDKNLE